MMNKDMSTSIERILRERLEQFNVPAEVRTELKNEILAFFQRPDKKPYGASIMTPEASMASDQARKDGKVQESGGPTPLIM